MKRTTTSGIDDLLKDYKPQPLAEPPSPIVVVGENKFTALMERYKRFLDEERIWFEPIIKYYNAIEDISKILTPEEINQFLQMTIEIESHDNYQVRTGIFLSRLIQNSYDAGNNDFHLDTTSLTRHLTYFCMLIEGEEERPININIRGDVGYSFGFKSQYAKFTITGNVGLWLSTYSKFCNIFTTGNVGPWAGNASHHCTYTLAGNVESNLGENSQQSNYFIGGTLGNCVGINAMNCVYKTSNLKTLHELVKYLSNKNKIYFINSDGKEELVRA